MPQVPTYGAPKVARDPLSAGKLNPVQSNAGEVIGKALGGLGDALQGVGQTAHKLQLKAAKAAKAASTAPDAGADDDNDDDQDQDQDGGREVAPEAASDDSKAAALEAQRQADQDAAGISDAQLRFSAGAVQQLGPDGGLTGLTGRDALAAAAQVRQGIGDAFDDAVDSLPPGPARAQGLVALQAQRAGAERLLDRHMASQPAVQLKQSLAARVVGFQQQTAPLYLIDPALAEHNLAQMDLAQRELDLRSGVPIDRHLANQLQNRSTAWSSLVQDRIAAGDWHGAQAVLKDRAGELTYADRTRLAPAVTDGANMADGQAWAQGSLSAGWAGLHVEGGGDPVAAPPVGVDPQAHRVRAAAGAAGATLRERERLVAETVTGGLDPGGVAEAASEAGGEGDPTDGAVAAALDRDRTAQQLAGRVLGREPDDWQVAFVARQPAPQAAAALLAASRDGDVSATLAQAGASPEAAQALITAAGARPGAKVGEVLDAARDGYGRALQQAAKMAAERPQALFTPDHLPDQEAYLALADLAAGPDPMRRKAYRAAAATRWRDLSDAQLKKRTDAWDAVAPELLQGVPYSKWDPAKQAALDPEDRPALLDFEAQGSQPVVDHGAFAAIRTAYTDDPEALIKSSPAALISRLEPGQFRRYMGWRAELKGRADDTPTQGQLMARRINDRVARGLKQRGVGLPAPAPPRVALRERPQAGETPTGAAGGAPRRGRLQAGSAVPGHPLRMLSTGAARRDYILSGGNNGRIVIASNPNAFGGVKNAEIPGLSPVADYDKEITAAALRHRLNPDLIRGVMYVETTHGFYDGPLDLLGLNKSILPMNINVKYWGDKWGNRKDMHDPVKNIEAGARVLRALVDLLPAHATVAQVATLYNNLSADKVSDYGARVQTVVHEAPWKKAPIPAGQTWPGAVL